MEEERKTRTLFLLCKSKQVDMPHQNSVSGDCVACNCILHMSIFLPIPHLTSKQIVPIYPESRHTGFI